MSFMNEILAANIPIRDACAATYFVTELQTGSLPLDIFREYIIQDCGDARLVSLCELQAIRQAVSIPIVVIGGINREIAALFPGMGIDGLAVISAILTRPDIRLEASELIDIFNHAKSSNHVE